MNNTLSPISYSPILSNPKLNPNKQTNFYKLPTQGVDVIEKINNRNIKEIPTKMLISLVKSGLTGEKPNEKLFVGRTHNDWVRMYNLAHNNALTAVALEGLNQSDKINIPEDVKTNMEITHNFAEKYHARQEKILAKYTSFVNSKGVDTVQMKGIGFSMNYPNPTARFGGDIDVYNYKQGTNPTDTKNNMSFFVDKILKRRGIEVETNHGPKHSNFDVNGMPFENHRNFLNVETAPLAEKMNKYLFKVINPHTETLPHGTKILVPSKEFNTVFIAFHAMQHFVGGGINLHHLTDWAVHVNKNGLKVPEEAKGTKFEEFMYAMTNLSNKHLGTNIKVPENKKLENEIMDKIVNPEKTGKFADAPKTKNPLKIIQYKFNRIVERETRKNEFWGEGTGSVTKTVLKSIKAHILNPKTCLKLFKIK